MKFIEIYRLQDDGEQKIIVMCSLTDDRVVCDGDEALVANLYSEGINDYFSADKKRLFPKDGLPFLEQLKNNLRSPYLSASETREK